MAKPIIAPGRGVMSYQQKLAARESGRNLAARESGRNLAAQESGRSLTNTYSHRHVQMMAYQDKEMLI
jgi:hypothetical protein